MANFYQDLSPQWRKYVQALLVILLVGLVASSFAFAFSYAVSAWVVGRTAVAPRQISVQGEGKVAVQPDITIFTAGVVRQAQRVGDAQKENTERSNAIIAFLKKQGVSEKDIKTVGYSISPQYDFGEPRPLSRQPPTIVGYEVRHTFEMKVRDLGKADTLLGGVVGAGANEVGSIRFSVDDEEKAKAEARKLAIEDAEKKARILAKDLGVRLTRVAGFFESGEGGPVPFFAAAQKGGFGGDITPAAPEVAPGEQEIRSTVTITYEFR